MGAANVVDTNVILRFLVETPASIAPRFNGVFSFFNRLERGEVTAFVPDLVLFEAFFTLTSFYAIPGAEAARVLDEVISFRGIEMDNKPLITECLDRLCRDKIGLVDAYILALSKSRNLAGVYSFDRDLAKRGLPLLNVE